MASTIRDFEPQRILIALPTWVGDFVMATPTLRAMRVRFPNSHITLLANPNLEAVIEGGSWMDEVLVWSLKSRPGDPRSGIWRLASVLRRREFDSAVLLNNSFRSALTVWLGGIERRIGYARDARAFMLTDHLKAICQGGRFVPEPMVEYYGRIAEYLGCDPPGDRLELATTESGDRGLGDRLQRLGIPEQHPIIVFAPGASFGRSKVWPVEYYAALGDRLTSELGARVLISCGPSEQDIGEAIVSLMSDKGTLLNDPPMTLNELKSLIRRARLVVCNDIGPRHFAKAFDVPVVTLFGPTDPVWTDTSYVAERKLSIPVDCGPCQKPVCPLKHHKCMRDLTVQMAYQACLGLWDDRRITQASGSTARSLGSPC